MKKISVIIMALFFFLLLGVHGESVHAQAKGDETPAKRSSYMGVLFGKKEITVKAKAQGEIIKMNFEEGHTIRENDVIAVADDRQKKIERDLASIEYDMSFKDYQKSVKLGKFISKDELFQKEGVMIKKKSTFQLKEVDLANTKVLSPISGVITKIYVDQGETVATGDKIIEVVQVDELILQANISTKDIRTLKLGSNIKFKVGDLGDQEFDAKLSFISPVIDSATETVRIKFAVKNIFDPQKNYILKPGMVAQILP